MSIFEIHDEVEVSCERGYVTSVNHPLYGIVTAAGHRFDGATAGEMARIWRPTLPLSETDARARHLNGASARCQSCGNHGAGRITGEPDAPIMCTQDAQQHHARNLLAAGVTGSTVTR